MMRACVRTAALAAMVALSVFACEPRNAAAITMSELMRGGAELLEPGTYTIRGRTLRCGDAQTLVAPEFWDYGGSLPDLIIVNPDRMRALPWRTQLFVYYHECAHQSVGSDEVAADCQAIRTGRDQGWLRAGDVEKVCTGLFLHSEGDRYHPPGPQRCESLRRCFTGETPARYTGGSDGFGGSSVGNFALDALNQR